MTRRFGRSCGRRRGMGLLDATLGVALLGVTGAWTASVIESHAARIAVEARIERVADYTRRLRGGISDRDLHAIAEHGHGRPLARGRWSIPQPLESLQNEDADSLRGDGDSDEAWLKDRMDEARLEAGLESGLATRRLLHSAGEFGVARGTGARNALSLWSVHHNDGGETNMYLVGRSRPSFNADDSGPTDIPRLPLPSGPTAASNFAAMLRDGSVAGPAARIVEGANSGGELREHGRFALPGDVFAVELVRSPAFECGPYVPARRDRDGVPICPSLGMYGEDVGNVDDVIGTIDLRGGTLRVEADVDGDEDGDGNFQLRTRGSAGLRPLGYRGRVDASKLESIILCEKAAALEACRELAPTDAGDDAGAQDGTIDDDVAFWAGRFSVVGELKSDSIRADDGLEIDAGEIALGRLRARSGEIGIADALVVEWVLHAGSPLSGDSRPRICQGCD